jgi:hypothetical protein
MDLREMGCEVEHWTRTVACSSEYADKIKGSIKIIKYTEQLNNN